MSDKHKDLRLNELEIEKRELDIQKIKKEIEKSDIEKIKIGLENIELQKGFLKKPQWWAFFTTFVVSAGTFGTLLFNGTFNSIKSKTEADKAKTEADFSILKLDKKEFEIEKDKAKKEFEIEKKKMDSLIKIKTDSLDIISYNLIDLKIKNESLISEKMKLLNYNNLLSNDVKVLKGSVAKNLVEIKYFTDSLIKLNNEIKLEKERLVIENILKRNGVKRNSENLKRIEDLKQDRLNQLQEGFNRLKANLTKCQEELIKCKNKQ